MDDERDYQRIVRKELIANDGRPVAKRGRICDRKGAPSRRK